MADKHSKTEKATPKRKNETRKKGQIAKTPELTAWGSIFVISFLLPKIFSSASTNMRSIFRQTGVAMANPTVSGSLKVMKIGIMDGAKVVAPVAFTAMAIGVLGNYAQVGFLFSFKPLKPKWSRLNPMTGVKRIFSPQGLYQLGKEALKLSLFGFLAWRIIKKLTLSLAIGGPFSTPTVVNALLKTAVLFLRDVAALGLVLAVIDYAVAKKRHNKNLMMSKQEVKEEAKNAEGNPAVKRELRKRMAEMTVNRMMSALQTADVVVTNPTHFAVALKYDPTIGAPKVLAKGADLVAARIKEVAADHKIPVVEDPPLARTLYRLCDIDQEIPRELFQAVAKLLAFIFTLKANGTVSMYGPVIKPPQPLLPIEIMVKPNRRSQIVDVE